MATSGKKTLTFIVVVIVAASITQTLSSQLTAVAFRQDPPFASPVSLTWFTMHGLLLLAIPQLWNRYHSSSDTSVPSIESSAAGNSVSGDGDDDVSPIPRRPLLAGFELAVVSGSPFLKSLSGASRILFLYILYVAANVSYVKALQGLSPALVSAVFCAAPGFVLFLSWPVLGRRVSMVEVVSVLCGFSGILLITQPWSTTNSNTDAATALYATISPAAAAVYKVFFSKFYTNSRWEYVGSRLGALSLVNVTLGTMLLAMYLSFGAEPLPWDSAVPWKFIIPSAIASVSFNFLVNFGVTITFPLFVSVASLLSTAVNMVLDMVLDTATSDQMDVSRWAGLVLVVLSLVMLIASVWYSQTHVVDVTQEHDTEQ